MKEPKAKDVTIKDIRKVQKVIIILFVLIIVLDVIFVLNEDDPFPTVSQVIHNSAATKYFVITWIWGVLTPQLFIVRKPTFLSISLLNRAVIILALTSTILILGQVIDLGIDASTDLTKTLPMESKLGQGIQALLFLSGAIISYFLWPNYSSD